MFHGTAHVYDLIYAADGKDYARESHDIHELIQQRFPHASTLLDVACGTGGHLAYLQRHYDVVGVDADPAMLEQARTRLPGIQLVEADMRSFRLDRHFDAVTCLFSSIGYMTSTAVTDAVKVARVVHATREGITTRLDMHHLVARDSGVDYIIDHHQLTLFARQEYQTAFQQAELRVDTTQSPMPGRDRYIGQQATSMQQPNGFAHTR